MPRTWSQVTPPSPKHRNAGSLPLPTPMANPELKAQLDERLSRCQHFAMTSDEDTRLSVARNRRAAPGTAVPLAPGRPESQRKSLRPRGLLGHTVGWLQDTLSSKRWKLLLALTIGFVALGAAVLAWRRSGLLAVEHDFDSGSSGHSSSSSAAFENLYGRKLDSIVNSVAALQGLSEVVAKADETYEEVYHTQLVQSSKASSEPDEADWNSFVLEARLTGPLFMEGKEKLRDAVANLHRLIRRAPEFMKNMVKGLSKQDSEGASWYLRKVVTLAESVHSSMEAAAAKFAEVDNAMSGMTRDARENEEHLEGKSLQFTDEASALEGSAPTIMGVWSRTADEALWGCILEKRGDSLDGCKAACLDHASGSCDRLTYYKTARSSKCYLHCSTATRGSYREADTFVLERAPEELVVDVSQKRRAGQLAEQLQLRWRGVRAPLQEVSRLVRRFRSATAELRKGLEEVRFAAGDLKVAFEASEKSGRLDMRLLERRLEDVLSAVEDLGHTLTPMGER
ncbi:unnamed protein product [Polarella glacialis]|uniref:Uncharacterized protein n=1 Tax=Polarella glacialis TaxID=89957 RepID=A0A813LDM7_POLGL|nr:unnamed protein product [Polarella glacialis]